jgi:MFS transporter, FSR family, fosmidomycin resistance protein
MPTTAPSRPSFLNRRLIVLAAGHFTIDAYSSFFLPLLPLLVQRLGLNYAMVGGLTALASLSSSFSQPLFGLLADRLRRPWFVVAGPLLAALFMAAIGFVSSYAMLVGLLIMGGFGVAMFHPQTAKLAGASSPQRGLAMSFWVTGGTLGWSLGPAFATATVNRFGLDHTWVAVFPGLVMCACLAFWFSRLAPSDSVRRHDAPIAELRPVLRPLAMLYFTVVCRSAVSSGFATFLPLWVHAHGGTVTQGGVLTTVYLTFGALGGFTGGWLADRFGGRRVVRASFLLAIPFYVLFFVLHGTPSLAALFVGYTLMQASLPVNVVLGQELSPRHAGIISSLLMGAAWGLGALILYPIGAFADRLGLDHALLLLSSLIVVGALCTLGIGRRAHEVVPQD